MTVRASEFRRAIVTGAASGIGRALCHQLSAAGCQVQAWDIDAAGLDQAVDSAPAPSNCIGTVVDVANEDAVNEVARAFVGQHGAPDLLINNAGIALTGRTWEVSSSDLRALMGINYWGVVYSTLAFLPQMREANRGNIVNISSIFGIVGYPGMCAYNSSKFAVRGFSECLRLELDQEKSRVAVTCVHPGGVATSIVDHSRMGSQIRRDVDMKAMREEFEKRALTTPEKAAAKILKGAAKGKRRVLVGMDAAIIDLVQRLCPSAYQPLLLRATRRTIDLL